MTSPIGKKRSPNNAAFTLLELTLVAVLILVLLGISSPLLKRRFSDLVLRDASFNLSKLITYGQEKAVIDRKNFKISFDFQNRRYQLLEIDTAAEKAAYKKITGRFGRFYTLPQGITFKGDKNELILYPDGHCDEVSIGICGRDGEGYKITAKGFGNRITIEETGNEK